MRKKYQFIIKAFILEENAAQAERLAWTLRRFGPARGFAFDIQIVEDAEAFVRGTHVCDEIVFISVEQEAGSGLDIARRLREQGSDATLVLISHDEDAAIEGYAVDAAAYMLKSYAFEKFSACMRCVLEKLRYTVLRKNILFGEVKEALFSYGFEQFV